MPKFETKYILEISQPISKSIFAVATTMWMNRQKITVESLGRSCAAMRLRATPDKIRDMVKLSELLNRICPSM